MSAGTNLIALATAGSQSVQNAASAAVAAEGAKALARILSSEAAVSVMKQKGMDPG